jgi:hypothetical protein
MNAGSSLDEIKDGLGNEQAATSTGEAAAGTSLPAASALEASIPFLTATPVAGQADALASGSAPAGRWARAAHGPESNPQQNRANLKSQDAAKADSTRESSASHTAKESKRETASSELASHATPAANVQIPSPTAVVVQPTPTPTPQPVQTNPGASGSLSSSSDSSLSSSNAFTASNFAGLGRDYSVASSLARTSTSRQTLTGPNSSISAVSGAASDETAKESGDRTAWNAQGGGKDGLGSPHEQSQTTAADAIASGTTLADATSGSATAAKQPLGAQQSPAFSPSSMEAAGLSRSRVDDTAPSALLNKLPFAQAPLPGAEDSSQALPKQAAGSAVSAGENAATFSTQVQTLAADAQPATANSPLAADSNPAGSSASVNRPSVAANAAPAAAGGGARKLSFSAARTNLQASSGNTIPGSAGATTGAENRPAQAQDSSLPAQQGKDGSQSPDQTAASKVERAAQGPASQAPLAGNGDALPAAAAKPLLPTAYATANSDASIAAAASSPDDAAAAAAASGRSGRTAKQGTAASAHGTAAEVSANSSAHAQSDLLAQPGTAQGHSLSASRETTGGSAHNNAGNSNGGDSESTTSKTFAALDAEPATQPTSWIRAGAQQAEAGYKDPELGWVGVRADATGGVVHASLVPGSADASTTLGSHLDGLNAYLAEHHAQVQPITVAAPESRSTGLDMGQNMHQQMNQGSGQGAQQGSGQQSGLNMGAGMGSGNEHGAGQGAPAETYFAPQATATPAAAAVSASTSGVDGNSNAEGTVEAAGSNGVHISVVA